MHKSIKKNYLILGSLLLWILACPAFAAPGLSVNLGDGASSATVGVQLLILLTVLSVAPSILLMTTSFVRFIIVFGMLRTAMGLGQMPPTQVLIGLSLILTFVVMQPTFQRVNDEALQPFLEKKIDEKKFIDSALIPLKDFMLIQTGEKELELAYKITKAEKPKTRSEIQTHILMMSFMLSELKKSFQIGFMLFLPFIIIDMITASALVSIGLMFLPPTTLSLPFKLVLFILIDGWNILSEGLIRGFIPA
jgi:flagellar biosynthetic protein FliP